MKKEFCPHCHQSVMAHKHGMTKAFAQILYVTAQAKQPFHLQKTVAITKNQYTNFHKLRYWLFIEEMGDRGWWRITDLGYSFLADKIAVSKWVRVFNNKVIERSDEGVRVSHISKGEFFYKQREEYAADAIPYKQEKDQLKFL